jgi:hypothetical protein
MAEHLAYTTLWSVIPQPVRYPGIPDTVNHPVYIAINYVNCLVYTKTPFPTYRKKQRIIVLTFCAVNGTVNIPIEESPDAFDGC